MGVNEDEKIPAPEPEITPEDRSWFYEQLRSGF